MPRLPIMALWKRKVRGITRPERKLGQSVTQARMALMG